MSAETPEEWADHIAELVTPDGRKAEIIHAIECSVRAEREACAQEAECIEEDAGGVIAAYIRARTEQEV